MKLAKPLSVALAAIAISCSSSSAQMSPKLLPFQGRLTDQNGLAVSNGVRLVQFKIYGVPTGGSPVWAGELHRTTVNGGLVNVLLGSKTPFTGVDFEQQLYLEITVDINGDNSITLADPPMLPRQAILPVVFAKESADSRLLDGHDWSAILVNGSNNPSATTIRGDKIQAQGITAAQIANNTITSNQIAPQTIDSSLIKPGAINLTNLSQLIAEALNPPGTVIAYAGSNVPSGWLPCDGSAVSRTSYTRLFEAIGTFWGVGDGSTTFNLPDLRGRVPMGSGNAPGLTPRSLGTSIGSENQILSINQLPPHDHLLFGEGDGNHRQLTGSNYARKEDPYQDPNVYYVYNIHGTTLSPTLGRSSTVGSGNPVSIVQPSLVLKYLIKL